MYDRTVDIVDDLFDIFKKNICAKVLIISAKKQDSYFLSYACLDLQRQLGHIDHVVSDANMNLTNDCGGVINIVEHDTEYEVDINPMYYDFVILHGTRYYDHREDHMKTLFPNGRFKQHCMRIM